MHRRLIALVATAVIALVAVAACTGAPSATPIADPSEIVAQSLDAVSKAKTVHARADVTGTIPFDLGSLMPDIGSTAGTASGYYSADPTHPNAVGHARMAQILDLVLGDQVVV